MPAYKGDGRHLRRLHRVRQDPREAVPRHRIGREHHGRGHLGIIAYQLKRSLKWDAAKQEFPGDEEANRLLDRARREPWEL